jgi:hypothetical protein
MDGRARQGDGNANVGESRWREVEEGCPGTVVREACVRVRAVAAAPPTARRRNVSRSKPNSNSAHAMNGNVADDRAREAVDRVVEAKVS